MKKIAVTIISIAITLASFAQDSTYTTTLNNDLPPKFRMGLSVSPIMSWFATDGEESFSNPDGIRLNIKYGLHMDFRLGSNPNYFFSTGVFVMNTGGKIIHTFYGDGQVGTQTLEHRINYVNVPLSMMLRTNQIGYMTYFARVGFDTGFAIKSNFDTTTNIGSSTNTEEEIDDPDLSGLFRFGLHLEGGVEFNLTGNTNLFISAEWNNGLNNVFSDDYKIPTEANQSSDDYKRVKGSSNALLINVGVYF